MTDLSHLNALQTRLSHERARLVAAKTKCEREMRAIWVAGCEKEIAAEYRFLGIDHDDGKIEMSDDELMAALGL